MSHAPLPQYITELGGFDASQIAPNQVPASHPVGQFPARVTDTEIEPTAAKTGWFLKVTFNTPAGDIVNRYNLANPSEKAMSIAKGQFSALCHATGIFQVRYADHCAALRGGRCQIVVGEQNGEEAKEKGYTEIKKVLDPQGNEPGKAHVTPAAQTSGFNAPPAQQVQQPPQQQPAPAFDKAPPPQNDAWGAQPASGNAGPAANDPWGANANGGTAGGPWGAR